jgi:hypothetical protein
MKLPDFATALKSVKGDKLPHVLLGNGFSRACLDDIFSYDSLFDRSDFKDIPYAREAFGALGTTDFEVVMKSLHHAAQLAVVYQDNDTALADRFAADAEKLKDVLVRAIAENHPEHPFVIPKEQYENCKSFLVSFDRKFTVNYDLLLYWAVMQSEIKPDVPSDDGFRKSETGAAEYVSWEPENTHYQSLYYLHGALHVFDSDTEVKKFTWSGTGIKLIEQIRDALDKDMYPLFVAEGDSAQKYGRIRHSDFLDKTYRSFVSLGGAKNGGALLVYGLAFSPNDEHIFRGIVKSNLSQVLVGIYGDPNSEDNKRTLKRAKQMETDRKKALKLNVSFYDSSTAKVWK